MMPELDTFVHLGDCMHCGRPINFRETMQGKIVLSVGWFSHTDGNIYTPTEEEKIMLDELHKRKIDLADEVLVLNVGGYVGESTRSEINYAARNGKWIRFFEDVLDGDL